MPTNRKRIQAYVNASTYEMLSDQANSQGLSVSEAASQILQTYLGSDSSLQLDFGPSSSFVTKADLKKILEHFEQEIVCTISREVAIAETRWESSVDALFSVQNSALEMLSQKLDSQPKLGRKQRKLGSQ